MNVNAMNQLYAEQMVSDYLRNEGLLYKYVIATSSDYLFMNEFNNSLLRSIPPNSVMTSIQQNGANGYTNGFYVGMVSSVMKIMNRLHDIPNITTQVRDYEFMLRSAFVFHNINHIPIHPWYFMKVRANCQVVWPVPYMSRTGRNPQTRLYYDIFQNTTNFMKGMKDCTCVKH